MSSPLSCVGRAMRSVFAVLVVCTAIPGCNQRKAEDRNNARISDLEKKVSELREKLDTLQTDFNISKFDKDFEGIAYLTPAAEGYSVVKTEIGTLTFKIGNVREYANGSRVTLQAGNTKGASINGLHFGLEWGVVDGKGSPQNETQHSRELELPQAIQAGSWNNVDVVLESVPPAQLGFVRVKDVSHKGISLTLR